VQLAQRTQQLRVHCNFHIDKSNMKLHDIVVVVLELSTKLTRPALNWAMYCIPEPCLSVSRSVSVSIKWHYVMVNGNVVVIVIGRLHTLSIDNKLITAA